jgi:hypothetical protein
LYQRGSVLDKPLLAARAAIEDLVHTYALNIRTGSGAECAQLFTEDAVFEVREARVGSSEPGRTRSRLTGRHAITTYVARTGAPETRLCPLIHNLLIQVRGHEASSTCVMTSLVWASGKQLIGEYQDSYRYETAWRFSSRIFTILGEFSCVTPPRQ